MTHLSILSKKYRFLLLQQIEEIISIDLDKIIQLAVLTIITVLPTSPMISDKPSQSTPKMVDSLRGNWVVDSLCTITRQLVSGLKSQFHSHILVLDLYSLLENSIQRKMSIRYLHMQVLVDSMLLERTSSVRLHRVQYSVKKASSPSVDLLQKHLYLQLLIIRYCSIRLDLLMTRSSGRLVNVRLPSDQLDLVLYFFLILHQQIRQLCPYLVLQQISKEHLQMAM